MAKQNPTDDAKTVKCQKLKKKISAVDRELVQMLETRLELTLRLAKQQTIDSSCVEETMAELGSRCSEILDPTLLKSTYDGLLSAVNTLKEQGTRLVGFQGEHGAYGEVASRTLVPSGAYMPCLEFVDVFDGVESGLFDFGVVPVENSLEGAVTQVNDLLTRTRLKVIGEVKVPIHHCLLAPKGVGLDDIRIVYSHPQALAQCREFLLKHRYEARPFYDTAGAAKMIDRQRPLATAAIASRLCSKLYGLTIVEERIEDADSNTTRFQLISKTPYAGKGEKCSIIFAVSHSAGSLQSVLNLFADAKINLTRIASTPHKQDPGNYTFFCDFEGSDKDPVIRSVLNEIAKRTKEMVFLGCYPKGLA